jgi:hypothetical protein
MYDLVYVYYSDEISKKNALIITENVVYLPEILCLNNEDNEYLSYLNLIKKRRQYLIIKRI